MRTAFIDGLLELARHDESPVLMVGDLGYSVIEPFEREFPELFYNAGISEQNMMGMAAGLASEGRRVFVYSIGNFPTFRCAEQIRNDVAYHQLPVTIVSVGGGLVYGNMGYSHHAIQDYGLMRLMPGMRILAPGDPHEVRMCLKMAATSTGPSYLRLGNPNTPLIHSEIPQCVPGAWLFVAGERSSRNALVTTGGTLALAKTWLDLPQYSGFGLYSVPCWGMDFAQTQEANFEAFDRVVTVEDHLFEGGFGSWLLESAARYFPDHISKISVKALASSVTTHVAKEDALRILGELTP